MRIVPNEDQSAFLAALEQMMGSPAAAWHASPGWARFMWSNELDKALEQNGYYDCAAEETLGAVSAAAMTYRLAQLPVVVEGAASSLVRARFLPALPRPFAVIEGDLGKPVRLLPVAKTVLRIAANGVYATVLGQDAVEPVESLFAYPMGRLAASRVEWTLVDASELQVRHAWRTAVAAELAGVLKAGLDAVVAHVTDRQQFGHPLGSFQAIQHRLASAAVKIEAAHLLTLKACQTGDEVDALTALGYIQDASTKIIYDLHQFMGAMGLTLEHPLHRWTYRARLLRTSMGGSAATLPALSKRFWIAE
jgi:hypothetical protein